MKQSLLIIAVFALTATGGAPALGETVFECGQVFGQPGAPGRGYCWGDDLPWVNLNQSPGSEGCTLYDNTTNPLGISFCWYGFAIGDEVVLAGAGCIVTELLVGLHANVSQYVDVRVEIYANDGPDGKPGTQLWDSGWVARWIPEGSTQQLISFPVPDVCVPGRITFAVEHSQLNGVAAKSYKPPTVGEWARSWWRDGGSWDVAPDPEEAFPFMARVIAQPCGPSAMQRTRWGRVKALFR
jgi:hypothetical protein